VRSVVIVSGAIAGHTKRPRDRYPPAPIVTFADRPVRVGDASQTVIGLLGGSAASLPMRTRYSRQPISRASCTASYLTVSVVLKPLVAATHCAVGAVNALKRYLPVLVMAGLAVYLV